MVRLPLGTNTVTWWLGFVRQPVASVYSLAACHFWEQSQKYYRDSELYPGLFELDIQLQIHRLS